MITSVNIGGISKPAIILDGILDTEILRDALLNVIDAALLADDNGLQGCDVVDCLHLARALEPQEGGDE